MRIAICGPEKQASISKAENVLKVESKKPWENSTIIDYAADTYKYFNENDVIFSGSPFDFLSHKEGEGYDDVYEQIALNSLANVDYIVVITMNMDRDTLKMYKEYSRILPNKFYFYSSDVDFEIVMK